MEGKNNLVIVESPAKAKTIQKFLGKDYTVKSSFGHIRDLQEKKLSIDVNNGFKPEYVIPADKKKLVSELKSEARNASTVWLASDEDREGEAISWHLMETLEIDPAKAKRIAFHEITKNAIVDAIEHPREIDMNLVNAQQARRVLDRLVGFELSPILWRKIQPKLSAGRVQSVALRLVVDKEREIMAFESKPFYKVEATFHPAGTPASTKVKAALDTRFEGIEEARKFLQDSIGASFTVGSVETKSGVRVPAAPFTTSTLQQEASRVLHLPVSTTMRIAQGLYERGLITYMRTDSTNLSSLALGTAKKYITENFGEEYSRQRQYKTKSKGAQEAHEAIRPTFIDNVTIEGTAQEQKLYALIWRRTVASQMADAKVLNTTIKVDSDKRPERFSIQATNILFDGYMKLYRSEDESEGGESTLPELHQGDVLEAIGITAGCKFTAAPARYSEATLVKKLEELGIGRPSTYAPIISTLTVGRGYIIRGDKEGRTVDTIDLSLKKGIISESAKKETIGAEKGKLLPQEIGIIVSDYLVGAFPDIMDYDFTANVEKDFDRIAEGELGWGSVISSFYSPFHTKVESTISNGAFAHVSRELGTAPDGEALVAKFGQFGPYIQKGPAEKRQFASLGKGQLIENITVEEALKLFSLPRTVGEYNGLEIKAMKGRFGPYLKYGEKNLSLPRGTDPLSISLEQCIKLIEEASSQPTSGEAMKEFGNISVINGRYGPYIKADGKNYKLPAGTQAASLTEEDCKRIIAETTPTTRKKTRFKKKQ